MVRGCHIVFALFLSGEYAAFKGEVALYISKRRCLPLGGVAYRPGRCVWLGVSARKSWTKALYGSTRQKLWNAQLAGIRFLV